jgi:hypothetical protein
MGREKGGTSNVQHPTLNVQLGKDTAQLFFSWALDVERWTFLLREKA